MFCSVAAVLLAPEVCLSVYCVWRPGSAARGSVPHCVLHAAFLHFFFELLRDGTYLRSCCHGKFIPKVSHLHFKPLTCYNILQYIAPRRSNALSRLVILAGSSWYFSVPLC
jgi:hypothetical protein